jgi:hypothetical protein
MHDLRPPLVLWLASSRTYLVCRTRSHFRMSTRPKRRVSAVVVAVIIIPLLLFGIELILLGLVVAAGIVGRGGLSRLYSGLIMTARSVRMVASSSAFRP